MRHFGSSSLIPASPLERVTLGHRPTQVWEFVGIITGDVGVASGNWNPTANGAAFLGRDGTGYTSFQEGDLLIAGIAYRSTPAFASPAGNAWNLVATQQSTGNTTLGGVGAIASVCMWWIIRGSANPDFTFLRTAGDAAQGTIIGLRGHALSPYDTGSSNTLAVASATNTTTTITTAENNELLVCFSAHAHAVVADTFDAATGATTASSGGNFSSNPRDNAWLKPDHLTTALGADAGWSIAHAVMVTAGATGTVQATASTSARHAMVVGAFKRA